MNNAYNQQTKVTNELMEELEKGENAKSNGIYYLIFNYFDKVLNIYSVFIFIYYHK